MELTEQVQVVWKIPEMQVTGVDSKKQYRVVISTAVEANLVGLAELTEEMDQWSLFMATPSVYDEQEIYWSDERECKERWHIWTKQDVPRDDEPHTGITIDPKNFEDLLYVGQGLKTSAMVDEKVKLFEDVINRFVSRNQEKNKSMWLGEYKSRKDKKWIPTPQDPIPPTNNKISVLSLETCAVLRSQQWHVPQSWSDLMKLSFEDEKQQEKNELFRAYDFLFQECKSNSSTSTVIQ